MGRARAPDPLQLLAASAGPNARAGSPAEAAQFGEVVVLAPPWPVVGDALQAAGSLADKILIDCTNPLKSDLSGLEIGHTTSAAEEVARRVAGARVVKAFNSIGAANMANPVFGSQRATMFFCGDDAAAKSTVARLVEEIGFEPVDAGALAIARLLEPLAMLWIHLAYARGMGPDFAFKLIRR
jgi:predicted dinucleotide-binding enzyme